MRCWCKRRKSPSFANFIMFVSCKKVQSCTSLQHLEIECVPDAVMNSLEHMLEFEVLASSVTLNCQDALLIKEQHRCSQKVEKCFPYICSLILKKNENSPFGLEYFMWTTWWESAEFGIYCSLCVTIWFLQIKKYKHTWYMNIHTLKYLQSVDCICCKVRDWFLKLGDLQN